jgi:hypothetical protein
VSDDIAYGHRWHECAANNVLMALHWEREAMFEDRPRVAKVWRRNALDRAILANGCSENAKYDELHHGSVFPGVCT